MLCCVLCVGLLMTAVKLIITLNVIVIIIISLKTDLTNWYIGV